VKPSSLLTSALAAAFFVTAIMIAAQDRPPAQQVDQPAAPAASGSQAAPQQGDGRPLRNFPAPTNLKVLPRDTTGRQVRDIMQKWAGSLGVHCDTCHVADPNHIGPNGRPRLNYADDSKTDKQIARIMYTMTEQMNKDYISKAMDLDKDDMGTPVTCGTCHRGHKMPEEFVVPRENERGDPGSGSGAPADPAAPPAAPAPPSN
jgi:Photosynthetic reaction centre cytochrome C subunit